MIGEANGKAGYNGVPAGTVKSDLRRFHEEQMQQGKKKKKGRSKCFD
jgi:hypothetical protein